MKKIVTRDDALSAVRTLLEYIGENPDREGLLSTPKRVVDSYTELFSGYKDDPDEILNVRFFDIAAFQDIILLKNIHFSSICEHHMLPIVGRVDIAYIPDNAVVGISKLARIVQVFAKRLQIQEKMTVEIAEAIHGHLKPLGVAVMVSAVHHCMKIRGVNQIQSTMDTSHYTGVFVQEAKYRAEFLNRISKSL